jgi:predicted F0F1-ATPase subunit
MSYLCTQIMVLKHIRKLTGKRSQDSKIYRELAPYLNLGWQLAITIGLGSLIGWLIDNKYHSTPTWLIICSLIGVAVGMYTFLKTVLAIDNKKKKEKRDN